MVSSKYDIEYLLLVASSSSASTSCRVSSGVSSSRIPEGGIVSVSLESALFRELLCRSRVCEFSHLKLFLTPKIYSPSERDARALNLSCLILSSFEISFTYSRLSWQRLRSSVFFSEDDVDMLKKITTGSITFGLVLKNSSQYITNRKSKINFNFRSKHNLSFRYLDITAPLLLYLRFVQLFSLSLFCPM